MAADVDTLMIIPRVVYGPKKVHTPDDKPPGNGTFMPYSVPSTVTGMVKVNTKVKMANMRLVYSVLVVKSASLKISIVSWASLITATNFLASLALLK